jgi:maltooligosyltrehalose trehalohydrolase
MGEEYGERAPFLYFTDFEDPALREAVGRGRREEFAAFGWTGEIPDPHDPANFARSKLNWDLQGQEPHCWLWDYYQTLLALRRQHPVLGTAGKRRLQARQVDERTLLLHRRGAGGAAAFAVLHFGHDSRRLRLRIPPGPWRRLVDSAEARFGGPGANSPALLPLLRGGWAEIEIGSRGALVYLREPTAIRTATAKAEAVFSVPPVPGERNAA